MPDPQIQALSQELQSLTRAMREMVSASSKTVQAQVANQNAYFDAREQLEEFEKSLLKSNKMSKEEKKLRDEALRLKKLEIQLAKKAADSQNKLEFIRSRQSTTAQQLNQAQQAAAKASQAYTRAQRATQAAATANNAVVNRSTGSLKGFIKSTDTANAALVWFGSTVSAQATQMLAQVKASSGVIEGTDSLLGALLDQQSTALKFRVAGDVFAQVTNQARQMFNAMGGTNVGLKQFEGTIDRMYILTGGDAAAALKLATESARDLAEMGIRPTAQSMERYADDLVMLQKQTGMSTEVARQTYDAMLNDVDMIDILRSARQDEREAIVASQRALLQQAIAAGMSAKQAQEAAKMLNKMVAAKPLDRLKQAAKVRALSGAMGIEGGEAAAQAIIAGKRATAEQKQALMQFNKNAANMADQMAGQGLGAEIFSTALLEKLNLEEYYGKGSNFSTTIGDTLAKPLEQVSREQMDLSKNQHAQTIAGIMGLLDRVKLILSGQHWYGVIAAGIGAIVTMLASGKIASMIGSAVSSTAGKLGGLFGKAAPAAATAGATAAASAAPAGAKAASTIGGKIASAAKVAGVAGSALDVGLGVTDLMNGKAQESMSGLDYISPMRWGMFAGDKFNKWSEAKMGDSIGGKIHDFFHGDEVSKMLAPTPLKTSKAGGTDAASKTAKTGEEIKAATVTTADAVSAQVKKLDTSNDLLKKLTEMSEKQTELMEKQLVAMTMTEKERQDTTNRSNLRRDNRFGSQYNYV